MNTAASLDLDTQRRNLRTGILALLFAGAMVGLAFAAALSLATCVVPPKPVTRQNRS